MNSHRSAKHIVIDRNRLPYYLDLREPDVEALVAAGLIPEKAREKDPDETNQLCGISPGISA
jgi:hypothetical protein